VTDGKGCCSGPVIAGLLVEDVGEVIGHGFLAQPQCLGDLAIALPLSNQPEDRHLPAGQVGRERWSEGVTSLMGQRTQSAAQQVR
jgi:hypothetical protein